MVAGGSSPDAAGDPSDEVGSSAAVAGLARDEAPVVRLDGVGMTYGVGGRSPTAALDGVDLEITRGEFVSLIGPSGCGKSTLLRIVADLVRPTSGRVLVGGRPPAEARAERAFAMVFQAPVLFDWRTVRSNVELPLELMGRGSGERAARVLDLLELVDLTEFAGHRPYQLSGGMQQRVAIARALASEPALLLMDEPFGSLDEMTRERMNDELLRIRERTGTTVLFVTHSIPEAVFLSTRILVMTPRPGRIARTIAVDLPRPRADATRESGRYFELVTEVREALQAGRPA